MFWLDIQTPKQVWLMEAIKKHLEVVTGKEILITSREHDCIEELLVMKEIKHYKLGTYGGESKEGKLIASIKRTGALADLIQSFDIDWCIHASSPEASRVCIGLGIKNICLTDTPHATIVNRLTFPFADWVISPTWVQMHILQNLGAQQIMQYDGVDQVAWLKDFKPESKEHFDRLTIVFRPPEVQSSYMPSRDEVPSIKFVEGLAEAHPEAHIIILPRYWRQKEEYRALAGKVWNITVPEKCIDAPNLIYSSSLVISGGGTMAIEAALLGTNSITYFPLGLDVVNYLQTRKYPIYQFSDSESALQYCLKLLKEGKRKTTVPPITNMQSPLNLIQSIIASK